MLIVSRWLRERRADEGRLLFFDGPFLPLQALMGHCAAAASNADAMIGAGGAGASFAGVFQFGTLVTQPRSSE